LRLFIDGVLAASTAASGSWTIPPYESFELADQSPSTYLGMSTTTNVTPAFYDSIRISNTARYTSNFTPPTAKFANDGNTVFLENFPSGTPTGTLEAITNSTNAFIPIETGHWGGAGPARNVAAFSERLLNARALVDVTTVDQQVTVFGQTYSYPFGISAVGYAGNFRRHADQYLAEAAAEANIPFAVENMDVSDTPEVRDLFACLGAVVSSGDDISLFRAAALPQFNVDPQPLRAAMRTIARESKDGRVVSLASVLDGVAGGPAVIEVVNANDAGQDVLIHGPVINSILAWPVNCGSSQALPLSC